MKIYPLLLSALFLVGCYDTNVTKYTRTHPDVKCVADSFECPHNSYYQNGKFVQRECNIGFKCSDGVIINDYM